MVRVCCVPGCKYGYKAPSHKFPRNIQRRLQWYKQLNMEPVEGPEEKKLRICYRHFRDNDYNCSQKMRVLVSDAIPSINLTVNENTATVLTSEMPQEMEEVAKTGNEEQHDSLRVELSDSTELERIEEIQHTEELISQQKDMNDIASTEDMNDIASTEERTTKVELPHQTYHRPELREIIRKSALSPKTRELYDTTVKLKRQKRNLKRLCNKYKQKSRCKMITLRTTNYKGRANSSAQIRQQFIDMIIRNNEVVPQVKFQVKLSKLRQRAKIGKN